MNVGLLVITHGLIGEELITTARSILGESSSPVHSISIPADLEPAELGSCADQIRNAISKFNSDQGVLILTDVYGATPSNLAHYFATDLRIEIISGVNLPMLIRLLNYKGQTLDQMATTAIEGAKKGIIRGYLK
jgi:PTS system mannose-specific IIA component